MKNGIGYRFAILSRLTRPLLLTGLLVFAQAGLAASGEIAAHRGGFALTPENTLAAFRLGSLESPLFGSSGQRAVLGGLADLLLQIAEVSGRVSDQLALRFFVHVDASRGTLSS